MGEWIKCSERLPDNDNNVWCYGTHENEHEKTGFEGFYSFGRWKAVNNGDYIDGGYGNSYIADVTHWQPLPEPPND